ncbi:MAG: sugar-binding protein [Planctomycetota bacterium]|jgi:hypothetical protein
MKAMRFLSISLLILAASAGCKKREAAEPAADVPPATAPGEPIAKLMLPRWPDAPVTPQPVMGIPKLAEPFVADGELTEWGSALSAPVRAVALAIYLQGDQEWLGPDDASMDCFVAWTEDGLCVASVLRDNELFNDRPADVPWDHDCATVVIQSAKPASADTTAPAWKVGLLAVPPRAETPAETYALPKTIESDITTVIKRCPGGYIVEAVFPWSVLPDVRGKEGEELAVRFAQIDYDRRDGEQVVPRAFVWHTSWYPLPTRRPPGKPARAVLIDQLARSAKTDLESEVFIDVDHCPPAKDTSLPVSVDLGINIGDKARSIELIVDDWQAQRVLQQRLPLESTPTTAGVRKSASHACSLEGLPYGQYTMTARILGEKDAPLGFVERRIVLVRGLEEEVLARIEKADLGKLAAAQPFHAIDWLEAATNLERFRLVAAGKDIPATGYQARQLDARLGILERGKRPAKTDEMFDLLALATDPEAQVIVEYYPIDQGHVSLYWGPVPIVTVTVQQFADDEAARAVFRSRAAAPKTKVIPDAPPLKTSPTHRVLQGARIISATNASAEVAKGAVAAVAAGEPIALAQIDAFRKALARGIEVVEVRPLPLVPKDMKLFVGDMHMHTLFSGGTYSPVYMALQSFAGGMDFSIITDHNNIVGGQLAQAHSRHFGFNHSVIVGDEISTAWAHLNGYPLRELVDWELAPYELVRSVRAQGAAIQWSHPDQDSEWGKVGFAHGLGALGVDAWEHVPPDYETWRKEGRLPTLVGSTDEHMGYFFNLERSIILAPSAAGTDVAEAVRRGNVCLIEPALPNVLYGAPHMIGRAGEAIREGTELRARRAARIQAALADLDITGLITTSGVRRVDREQADEIIRMLQTPTHADHE